MIIFSRNKFLRDFLVRANVIFSIQGRMFLFVGIVMAVLQGGIVRRIPQGKERRAAMG